MLDGGFSVATDFSGMDMPIFALRSLGVNFTQTFACDNDPACRTLIKYVHNPDRIYSDAAARACCDADAADLYVRCAPCTPFSTAGNGKGDQCATGSVYQHSLEYMKKFRPRAVLLENVIGLVQRHRQVVQKCFPG